MEQRPLRLGDIVDDYCPRERRITNHAIVVMSGDEISLTRCTACEAEHSYKHAKAPVKKKKDANGALYDEVLAGVLKPKHAAVETHVAAPEVAAATAAAVAVAEPPVVVIEAEAADAAEVAIAEVVIADVAIAEAAPAHSDAAPEPEPAAFAWGHRPLIRAQLPRVEGQAPVVARPLPDFTIRQQGSRGYGQPNHNGGGSRRQGQGGQPHGNGHGGGHGRGGRDQGGRSNGRPRHSR